MRDTNHHSFPAPPIQLLLFGYHDYRDDGNVGNDNYVTPATTLFQRLQFSCSRFMRKMYEFSH